MDICTYFSPAIQPFAEVDTPTFEKSLYAKARTKERSASYSVVSSTFSDSTLVVRRPSKIQHGAHNNYNLPSNVKDDGKNLNKSSEGWKADSSVDNCKLCNILFNFWKRKHHCRRCGDIFCANCTAKSLLNLQRYCRPCLRIRENYLIEHAVNHKTKLPTHPNNPSSAPNSSNQKRFTVVVSKTPRPSHFDPFADGNKSAERENVHQVFGVRLKDLLRKENNQDGLPNIVVDSIDFLSKYYHTEGLFRISGDAKDVKQIISDYNQGKKVDFSGWEFPHTIAVVLKKFIFDLPDHNKLPLPASLENMNEAEIQKSISSLPLEMQRFLKKLFEMLHEVSSLSDVNKMTPFNLAVVFAPNFAPDTVSVKCIEDSTKIIEFMIIHCSSLFSSSLNSPSPSLSPSLDDHTVPTPSPSPSSAEVATPSSPPSTVELASPSSAEVSVPSSEVDPSSLPSENEPTRDEPPSSEVVPSSSPSDDVPSSPSPSSEDTTTL